MGTTNPPGFTSTGSDDASISGNIFPIYFYALINSYYNIYKNQLNNNSIILE